MIGRKKEQQELRNLYEAGRAELIAVYGRRRVGKTYLIDETFRDRYSFQHAGLSPMGQEKKGFMKLQLEHFYISLQRYGYTGGRKPKSWMEAFYFLEKLLEEQDVDSRQLVFLDELPWLDTPRSGFLTAFEAFWNGWGCRRKNLMVIVCGSASSWILDHLINNHGGLYNRTTYEINLMPFTLAECEAFLEDRDISLSRYDIAQSYMAVGGIPYYLGYFRANLSAAQNIDSLFFAKGAKLRDEFDRLFESVFENPELIKSVVRILYTRSSGYTRSELLDKLRMKEGETFSKTLQALTASEFVEKYVPFDSKGNEPRYKLVDPFCAFWLRFVDSQVIRDDHHWLQMLDTQPVVTWRGLAFEQICWNHIPQIKKALGISGVSTSYSAWNRQADGNGAGTQVDLLLSRRDDIVNMCEMKFLSKLFQVSGEYYRHLLSRASMLSEKLPPTTSVHSTLITTFGLKNNQFSSVFTDVVTLDDLFQ